MKALWAIVMSPSLFALLWAGTIQGMDGASPDSLIQDSQAISIARSGSQPSRQAPSEHFTGSVRVDPLFQAKDPARAYGASVTFEPGARTAWHSHPLGQTLIVTAGCGRVQQWGGPIEEIRPGDVVWIPPGLKHWHGATATTGMTHIAISERAGNESAEWMEKVSDEQFNGQIGGSHE